MPYMTHKVSRAVIMAAGRGSRMNPLTLSIPKPLVKVNGKRMIDTIIDALHTNGITEIYVVTGYLKEQFITWAKKHTDIVLIDNPYYDTCNNISSLYVARTHLEDCMILDGDQIIYNPDILTPHFLLSGYNAVWCEDQTEEWLMQVDNDIIRNCTKKGGSHGWQLYSVSRWTSEDGIKLKKHVEYEFENGNRTIYWDDLVMFRYFDSYRLGIHKMQKKDIIEIDTINELINIDSSYKNLFIGGHQ